MDIIMNPGTGNVFGADLENAQDNVDAWLYEIPSARHYTCRYNDRRTQEEWTKHPNMARGRYIFNITVDLKDGRHFEFEVEMPGLPLDKVRFTGEDDQNIWDFPRLYVDGSSWVWKYSFSDFQAQDDE